MRFLPLPEKHRFRLLSLFYSLYAYCKIRFLTPKQYTPLLRTSKALTKICFLPYFLLSYPTTHPFWLAWQTYTASSSPFCFKPPTHPPGLPNLMEWPRITFRHLSRLVLYAQPPQTQNTLLLHALTQTGSLYGASLGLCRVLCYRYANNAAWDLLVFYMFPGYSLVYPTYHCD